MSKSSWLGYTFKLLRATALWVLDGIAVIGAPGKRSGIVAFVRVDAIGDFVLWFGSIPPVRDHFHNYRSVLICSHAVAELAEACGSFDEVMGIDIEPFLNNVPYRWRVIRSVRRLGAVVAVQPTFSRVFLTGDAIMRATGAEQRIGSIGDLGSLRRWQHRIANRPYSTLVPAVQKPLMEIERNCEFLRGLGINAAKPEVARLPKVAELSGRLNLHRDYFVVFPGAGDTNRMWPAGKFAQTALAVGELYGWQMVVCGGASETALADAVIERSTMVDAMNLAGKTSLPELVEVIRAARLLVGNETSAAHIAAAVGTPCVSLVGGGHFGRFMPYSSSVSGSGPVPVCEPMECFGCNWHCVKQYTTGSAVPCISAVGVPAVLRAIRKALGEDAAGDLTKAANCCESSS